MYLHMHPIVPTVLLLAASNVFMTFAWYAVFVPFAVFYMGQEIRMNFVYAGVCLLGAVYFIFRG